MSQGTCGGWELARRARVDAGLPPDLAPEQRVGARYLFGKQGSACLLLHFIESGYVSLRQSNQCGEERLLEMLGAGDVFGEDALKSTGCWTVSAEAVTPVVVRTLPARHLPRISQHYPQVAARVCEQIAARIERTYQSMDMLLRASARERVHSLLAALATRFGELHGHQVWLSLPLNQRELADLAQVRRETMGRMLAALESEGHIQRRGRRGMWVNGP
ncbi:MAG: Crp/Fnr family transcriptional regulator [Actinomycetota bacterium]